MSYYVCMEALQTKNPRMYGTHQVQLKHDTRGTHRGHRVAHACFCHIRTITCATSYLRVQGYMCVHHLFTHKV